MNPRPAHHVAAAIIRRGDEIALVLQGAQGEEPFWGLPGGVVEHDELVPEGLVREVLEETGLAIRLPAPPTSGRSTIGARLSSSSIADSERDTS